MADPDIPDALRERTETETADHPDDHTGHGGEDTGESTDELTVESFEELARDARRTPFVPESVERWGASEAARSHRNRESLPPSTSPMEFATPQDGLLLAALQPGGAAKAFADLPQLESTTDGSAVGRALAGEAVVMPGGVVPVRLTVLERWAWLWRRLGRWGELEREVEHVVTHESMSLEFKHQRIQSLLDGFWEEVDTPLGPDGVEYGPRDARGYAEETRTLERESTIELDPVLEAAAGRVLGGVVNYTVGVLLDAAGVDPQPIVDAVVANFVRALHLEGDLEFEASYAQLWLYPEDHPDADDFIDRKQRPAYRVARNYANAPDVVAFGVGNHLNELDAQLGPIADLVADSIQDPRGTIKDLLTGDRSLDDVTVPDPDAVGDAARHFVENLSAIGDLPGFRCHETTTVDGTRTVRREVCRRSIHYVPMAGPEPRNPVRWDRLADERYPVAILNTFVLPETSEVFLRRHSLFYKADVSVSYPNDFEAVTKDAVSGAARDILKETLKALRNR